MVLGSGGARGYAHIGVIEALEEKGYEIVSISGASMGALVGGLYACGKLDAYKEWVLGLEPLDVAGLLDLAWDKKGLMSGTKVFERLDELVGSQKIEELPLRFTAVASDLNRGKEVWFQEGDLLSAIRASVAIPSVFTPVELDGMLLVDGGVLNPLPVAPTMSDRSDLTVAVNLYGPDVEQDEPAVAERYDSLVERLASKAKSAIKEHLKRQEQVHIFSILDQSFDTMQRSLTQYRIGGYPPDVTVELPKNICSTFDFHKAKMLIEAGRKAVEETGL
ncbi:MAG: patatin-like phospholipase family protein [Campylobacterales bacterium]